MSTARPDHTPARARVNGPDVHVDNVNLGRTARALRAMLNKPDFTPPKNVDDMVEMMARAMGYPSFRALYVEGASQETLLREVETSGAPRDFSLSPMRVVPPVYKPVDTWPAKLPERFDEKWKAVGIFGLQQSFFRSKLERGDLVAILGNEGSGKSALARAFTLACGGLVIDGSHPHWELQMMPIEQGEKLRVVAWDSITQAQGGISQLAKYHLSQRSPSMVVVRSVEELTAIALALESNGCAKPGSVLNIVDLDQMSCFSEHIRQADRLRQRKVEAEQAAHAAAKQSAPAPTRSRVAP